MSKEAVIVIINYIFLSKFFLFLFFIMFKLSKSKHINFAKVFAKARNIYDEIPFVRRRRKRNRVFKFLKYFSISIIILFLLLVIFLSVHFLNCKLIYQNVISGKKEAEYVMTLIKEKDYRSALKYAKMAENNFSIAVSQLEEYQDNFFVHRIDFLAAQFNDFMYLLTTAEILSKAVSQTAEFGSGLAGIMNNEKRFIDLTTEEKRLILGRIYEAAPELNGIRANIDLALINLDRVQFVGLLYPFKNKISNLKFQLIEVQGFLNKAIPMSQLIPPLFGYPHQSAFLVILQNSDELRPTGGFISAYGILELANGDISRSDTHDIYHLDALVEDNFNISPPPALNKYLGINKWFMRDANWSPDWPTAANQIEWFYWEEDKLLPPQNQINNFTGEFDGIIAITPEFITDLLALTGPIYIEAEEYNQKNFVDLLEYKIKDNYNQLGAPAEQRKEVIGVIIKELKVKIFDLPLFDLYEAFNILVDNLYKKNIFIYFHDQQFQELAKEQGWAGELKKADGDYLMVVDADVASLKTDAVISRNINYQIDQGVNGLFADLQINYAYSGEFDLKTTKYETYTRVYVPLSSQLINVEEYSEGVETDDKASVQVYNELNKTVFATFLSIEPGDIGSLHYYYKLPKKIDNLAKNSQYNLYIQKQPGNEVDLLTVDLKFVNRVKSYSPAGFYVYKKDSNSIQWESGLMVDREFRVGF